MFYSWKTSPNDSSSYDSVIEIVTGEESHEAISLEELNETIASGEIVNANESTFMARNEIATQSKTTNRNDDDLITDDESDTLNETVKSKRITILYLEQEQK